MVDYHHKMIHFTSISTKGKLVVDCSVTSHNCLNTCVGLNVITSTELVESKGPECIGLTGDCSRLPLHSLLFLKFMVGNCTGEEGGVSLSKSNANQTNSPRSLPDCFLSS